MLLLLMMFPLLPMASVVTEPLPRIALEGRLAPTGPMLLFEIVLLSLPLAVTASVEKKIVPPLVATDAVLAPWMFELVITLLVAPPMNRIVAVPEVAETVVLAIVRELPPVLSPSMVTLSAPLKSIRGLPATIAPDTVRAAPPVGEMAIEA